MVHRSIENIVKSSPHLKWLLDGTCYIARHGSRAYGTNVEGSDEDFKGVAIPPKEYFFGTVNRFEQAISNAPDDVTIFDIRKFFMLTAQCNPNLIEVLHCDPSDHIYVNDIGQLLLDNKDIFLSKKVKHTFLGYAVSQLKRMKLHKSWNDKEILSLPTRQEFGLTEKYEIPSDQMQAISAEIQKELDKQSFDFMDDLDETVKQEIRSNLSKMLCEMKITTDDKWVGTARKIGLEENMIEVFKKERAYASKVKDYHSYQEWKKTRNAKRFADEAKFGYDCKHAYHLVRLIRMAEEILATGKVIVKRPDREELLEIRNGKWKYEELIEFAESKEKSLELLYNSSNVLPKSPNMKKIDDLCIKVVELSLSKGR